MTNNSLICLTDNYLKFDQVVSGTLSFGHTLDYKTVAPYIEDESLPDCVILQKGSHEGRRWYYKVMCNHCSSSMLIRSDSFSEKTVSFKCPVCSKDAVFTNEGIISYHPSLLREPSNAASALCIVM